MVCLDVVGFFSQITTVALCNIVLLYAATKAYFSTGASHRHPEKGCDTQYLRDH